MVKSFKELKLGDKIYVVINKEIITEIVDQITHGYDGYRSEHQRPFISIETDHTQSNSNVDIITRDKKHWRILIKSYSNECSALFDGANGIKLFVATYKELCESHLNSSL